MGNFHVEVLNKYFESLNNEYYDNFDFEIRKLPLKIKLKINIERIINRLFALIGKSHIKINLLLNSFFQEHINDFEYLYNKLKDQDSKNKLIELIVYRILGFVKVKLSLNNNDFWDCRKISKKYKQSEKIPVDFRDGYLNLFDLKELGFDIKLFFIENGITTDFILQQYNYKDIVKVEKDDIVVDAGGCWGDTALYFASIGAKQVYTFEFIQPNLDILKRNINMNPQYKETINIIDNPVWSESNVELSYLDKGPSSFLGKAGKFKHKTKTLTIDDLVKKNKIDKIDFIKMDIEGAELPALEGAKKVIKRDKPKLAISAYHKSNDLIAIPKFISSIRNDYNFYLDYYTIIGDETIVYAI